MNIDYARRRCKNTAQNLIKKRAKADSVNFYQTFRKMLNNITINFDIKNDEAHAIIKLKNSVFKQKTDETFSIFVTRLNFIFSLRSFSDTQKFMYLHNLITSRLKNVIIAIYDLSNYRNYTKQITQIVNNLIQNELEYENNRQVNKIKSTYFRKTRDNDFSLSTRTSRKSNKKKLNAAKEDITRLDSHIKRLCIEKNVCSKCFIKKHLITDKNASCKHEFSINVVEAKIKFVVLNIH